MVRCDAINWNPCKCELESPEIQYLLESIISNLLKLVFRTITPEQFQELRELLHIPKARDYLQLYLINLDEHRDTVSQHILYLVDNM